LAHILHMCTIALANVDTKVTYSETSAKLYFGTIWCWSNQSQ